MSLKQQKKINNKHFIVFLFQMCIDGIYDPLVFLKKPHQFQGAIVFGAGDDTTKGCPKDKSRIEFTATAGLGDNVLDIFNKTEMNGDTVEECPQKMLRFSPPPAVNECRKTFKELTTLTEYSANIGFKNVSNGKEIFTNPKPKIFISFLDA